MVYQLDSSRENRLGLALFVAISVHLLIILGLKFDFSDPEQQQNPLQTLEVTLVHSKSEKPPEKADYLAQVSQQGGGNIEEKVRPSSPLPNPKPIADNPGKAPQPQIKEQIRSNPLPTQQKSLAAEKPAKMQVTVNKSQPLPEEKKLPTASDLLMRSREIARLSAEIRERQELYAQKPRHKYITANTREYIFASYEDSWRVKVERIGNLNYPEEAKKDQISGTLLLDVAIRTDGTLESIKVLRSSGNPVLDEGAIHIVNLAAPFAPFSKEMREDIDILHITRAWQFKNGRRLETR